MYFGVTTNYHKTFIRRRNNHDRTLIPRKNNHFVATCLRGSYEPSYDLFTTLLPTIIGLLYEVITTILGPLQKADKNQHKTLIQRNSQQS